MTSYRYND